MAERYIGNPKEPLDEQTLNAVKREFDRLKKGTPYKRFSITKFVDNGSFAKVYKVESVFSKKIYAIRIAKDQGDKTQREIEAVKKLMEKKQDHIVDYLMTFPVNTQFGMNYCTLMDFLSPLSACKKTEDNIEIAVRCASDLLPLLQVCMENKILHRDIKPQNIMYENDFRNDRGFLLSDFGEARTDREGTVTFSGTAQTMAPEIAGYDQTIRHDHKLCDMYSLGIVMYYYMNGRVYPFNNDFFKRWDTKGALPEPRYGSKRLKQLVVRATQYYPKDRFASPRDMLRELLQCEEYRLYILHDIDEGVRTINRGDNISEEKRYSFCNNCGSILNHGTGFGYCTHCGASLGNHICWHCGRVLSRRDVFCSHCGMSQKKYFCYNCGYQIFKEDCFCQKCGADVRMTVDAMKNQEKKQRNKTKK